MTGVAAFGGFAGLASYRPYFIALTGLLLVYSFLTPMRKKYRAGTRHVNPFAVGRDEVILTVATVTVLLLIFFPYLSGVTPAADRKFFEGRGSIVHLDRLESKITLDHRVIDCLMPATAMEYDVAIPALLQGRKAGEQVRFLLSPRGSDFVVVRIWSAEPKKSGGR